MTTEGKLQEHLASAKLVFTTRYTFRETLPRIICGDRTMLSVQASSGHYCSPRDNDGPWDSVEVGYPSRKLDGLMQWAEDADRPTDTVYGYVPLSTLAAVIDDCGGFVGIDPMDGAS